MKTFIIDKKKWSCGKGSIGSVLREPDTGMSCCLGFAGQQLGVSDEQLGNETFGCVLECMYDQVDNDVQEFDQVKMAMREVGLIDQVYLSNTSLAFKLMELNDNTVKWSKNKRLEKLNQACEEYGANFRFAFKETPKKASQGKSE